MPAHTNYIRHLNAFFAQVRQNDRLHAHHISLYLALFQVWNQYQFQNPFPILRKEVIRLCRIGSLNTYTRCLKELHQLGYIIYQPAPQRGAPCLISIIPICAAKPADITPQLTLFEEPLAIDDYLPPVPTRALPQCPGARNSNRKNDTANGSKNTVHNRKNATAHSRKNDTGPVANLRSFNNKHINSKKRERENTPPPLKKNNKDPASKQLAAVPRALPQESPPPASAARSKPVLPGMWAAPCSRQLLPGIHAAPRGHTAPTLAIPELPQVQQFFRQAGYPELEARKFFHHYQSNGWRQRGGLSITNWHAATHKWMLNDQPIKTAQHGKRNTRYTGTTAQPGQLQTDQNKCYEDPL